MKTRSGDYQDLGNWCSRVRVSIKKMKNNEAPVVAGLTEDNIRRLKDVEFEWKAKTNGSFEDRLEQLKAFKAKHGHCNVKTRSGDDKSLGIWCSRVRESIKKVKNNEAPVVAGLSEDNIRRLKDVRFDFDPAFR